MIFSKFDRTDSSPKKNRETDFAFLDRSARPEMERARALLEELIQEYPGDDRQEMIARIRSEDDTHFRSAIFELILHSYLTRIGYKLQPHPELTNGSTARPDFFVVSPSGEEFYLEAVLASANYGRPAAAEARIGTVLDTLNASPHHNFLVSVEYEGSPSTQPSGVRLRDAVHSWLDSLDPEDVLRVIETEDLFSAPTFTWAHEGWEITFRPIPLKPERRGQARALIGLLDDGNGGVVDEWTPIRDAVKFKGSKYGDLGRPLIVAVNVSSFHLDRIDEMQALFGQEQIRVFPDGSHDMARAPNGAWYGNRGAQAKRVSGAWLFNDVGPYSIASRRHTVYFNPWALYPLPEVIKELPHAVPNENTIVWVEGKSLKEAFNLPEGWPGDG